MKGRKPLPTAVKLFRGNPGKRRLNSAEAKPPIGPPDCPKHLDKTARQEWKRVAGLLSEAGLLTQVDRAALACYCTAYGRWVEAEKQVKQFGTVILSPTKKFPMKSPYLSTAESAMEQMRKFLVEFGMTPSSLSRIGVGASGREGQLDEFLKRGSQGA